MDEPVPYRREWTISGLSSVCDRITAHPNLQSFVDGRFHLDFYPNGYDESCIEYVSFSAYNSEYPKYCFLEIKISIKNTKKENLFVKEWTMKWYNETIKEFLKRDYLLDPSNGLTHNDEFTLCFEGWLHREVNDLSNLENKAEWTRDYFDFRPLLSTKSLILKWTIENVRNLFEKSYKSSIELPEIKGSTETGEAIIRSRIELIKNLNNKKMLLFELKPDDKMPILIKTPVIDINQQKYDRDKKDINRTFLNGFTKYFIISEEIYSRESILKDNKLTLLCGIKMISESTRAENKYTYLQILEYFKVPSALRVTECTIDGETGEILQNKVVPLLSNIDNKEINEEKLEELSNTITEQTSAIDHAIIIVNNIYHEHYFENCNIKDSVVNTKSNSLFGDISFKSDKTDCAQLIEKLEDIFSRAIEPVLDKYEKMYTEMNSYTQDLFTEVLSNQEEMKKIKNELNRLKESKNVKQSKMKKIVDKIIALLNRIKFQFNKVGTKVSYKVTQVRQSKPPAPKSPEPTLAKSNNISEYIEPHISFLIEFLQSVTTFQTNSYKTKQSHIYKLETVKAFLIAQLSTENCSTINPNEQLEIDSITLENAEHKLVDIIDNHISDWDKKLLTKLRDLIVESKSESDNKEETQF